MLAVAVAQQLAKIEQRLPLQEELGDNAAHAKDVHGGLQRGTLTVSRRVTRVVEALRREVAAPAAARVEEEGEVRRVVRWQVRLLEACEVRQVGVVPGGEEHVLALDVAMTHAQLVRLGHCRDELKGQPLLFDVGQEGPRVEALAEGGEEVLTDKVDGLVGFHEALEGPHVPALAHAQQALPDGQQPVAMLLQPGDLLLAALHEHLHHDEAFVVHALHRLQQAAAAEGAMHGE
mmetsp:Transcript_4856/g.17601  ORF Transcript_4856/g.17601 Transcript_4856/m.17601 type:complete len:233 (-) Transcript_4856:326-1024(-)